jgi:ribosomal protein S18 acetylase RimI-like enzyme
MFRKKSAKTLRWRKIPKDETHLAEAFLRDREKSHVGASARFLRIREKKDGHVWYLGDSGKINALLVHHHQSLLPVFDKDRLIPGPRFLNRFLGKVHIHALQGLREDTELLEGFMEDQGYYTSERIDYDLMNLDEAPGSEALRSGPVGLVLRPPAAGDGDALFRLQSAYEQEEVLPKAAAFNPAVCRHNLEQIISSQRVLVAELDGQVVGKINTSAVSFTRYQVGGVYVRPDCRGRGIAAKMTAFFARSLLAEGRGITLFVKKHNAAARSVYLRTGFVIATDYRISYY